MPDSSPNKQGIARPGAKPALPASLLQQLDSLLLLVVAWHQQGGELPTHTTDGVRAAADALAPAK